MNKISYILLLLVLLCPLESFGQGQISRPAKSQTETSSKKRSKPKEKISEPNRNSKKVVPPIKVSEPTGYINGYGYVDLGLSSGTKWAVQNVCAKNSYESGGYYAWGEITTKADFTEENSLTHNTFLNDYSGDPNRDAATSAWGNPWRTPNRSDVQELIAECQIEPIFEKDLTGIKIIGPNGKSIFLPGVGGISNNSHFNIRNVEYWVSTPLDSDKYCGGYLLFFDNKEGLQGNRWYRRWYGLPVRPVIK